MRPSPSPPTAQPTRVIAWAVGEADNGLDEIAVRKRLSLLALELDVEPFAARDQFVERLGDHDLSPYGVESSRTCIGCVIAFTDR